MLAAVILMVFRPWRMPNTGIDPTWHLVLEKAFREGWIFGQDVIFTFGPWGFLYPKLFHSQLWGYFAAFEALLIILWTAYLWRFRSGTTLLFVAPLLLTLGLGMERTYVAIPLMAFMLVLTRAPIYWVVPMWAASAWIANTKFTFLVIAFALAAAADLACFDSVRRQRPSNTIVLGLLAVLAFVLAGQPLSGFLPFLIESFDLAAGYGESMNIIGSWVELALFVFVAAAALVGLAYGLRAMQLGSWRLLIAWLAAAGLLFILFRSGFTRHDGHSLIAWGGLMVVVSTMAVTQPVEDVTKRILGAQFGVLMLAMVLGVYYQIGYAKQITSQSVSLYQAMIRPAVRKTQALVQTWRPGATEHFEQRRTAVTRRALSGFRNLESVDSVDVLPWDGAVPILAAWDYRPRPVFQAYAAYTPRQQHRMKAFVERSGASEVYYSTKDLDNRWPGSSLGRTQVSLVSHYDVIGQTALGHALKRRQAPRAIAAGPKVIANAPVGEWVDVPENEALVVLQAELPLTAWGRVVKVLLNPVILLEGELSDGRVVSHRLLPGLLQSGIVVSPYLNEAGVAEYFVNQPGGGSLSLPSVKRIRVVVSELAQSMFGQSFQMAFQRVSVFGAQEHEPSAQWIADREGLDVLRLVLLAARRWDGGEPRLLKSPSGQNLVDAHARTVFEFQTTAISRISFRYGIRPGAWQRGETNGVRFEVSFDPGEGDAMTLLDKVVAPATTQADRDQQAFSYDFGQAESGTLRIAVTDNGDPRWDWAYLSEVEFDARRICVQDSAVQCIDAE